MGDIGMNWWYLTQRNSTSVCPRSIPSCLPPHLPPAKLFWQSLQAMTYLLCHYPTTMPTTQSWFPNATQRQYQCFLEKRLISSLGQEKATRWAWNLTEPENKEVLKEWQGHIKRTLQQAEKASKSRPNSFTLFGKIRRMNSMVDYLCPLLWLCGLQLLSWLAF